MELARIACEAAWQPVIHGSSSLPVFVLSDFGSRHRCRGENVSEAQLETEPV